MTNSKGLSAVTGTILGLVILSAVVAGGVLILKQRDTVSNPFELWQVKIGDSVAGMKIVSIKPFRESLSGLKPEDNLVIKFSGEATVSGKYRFDDMLLGENILSLDEDSQNRLPILKVGDELRRRNFMCLDDPESKVNYRQGGEGTFVVKDIVLTFYPSEGCASEGKVVKVED